MINEMDLPLADGRNLHVYDTGETDAALTVFWHHGTPNIGAPPEPLFATSRRLGIRWVSFDRPGYNDSTPLPGRDIASAAAHVAAIADALDIARFGVMGHSGGGSHALACGALLPDRVLGVVSVAGLAPLTAEGLDWFADMHSGGEAGLRAAAAGRAAKERYEETAQFDPAMFTASDYSALDNEWSWFHSLIAPATRHGPGGLIDDDLAYVAPWGFDPTDITVAVRLLHGSDDRVAPVLHGAWLANHCATAELWMEPGEGHISVLRSADRCLEWLAAQAG